MRYRDYKEFHKNGFFHIYNRGHNKGLIFKDDKDYEFFIMRAKQILGLEKKLSRWMQPLPVGSFEILSYCLMPNHFHFLIRQNTDLAVSKFIWKLCTSYSIYFNKKYGSIGSVFQDQFKAKLVDSDEYLSYLSVYIHKNPKNPLKWAYSSLLDYVSNRRNALTSTSLILDMVGGDSRDYNKFMEDFNFDDETMIDHLVFED